MMHAHSKVPKAIAAVVVVALIAGAVAWLLLRDGAAATGPRLSGTVEGTEYRVAPVLAGRITTVTVAEGDAVKAGDVVARIDDAPLRLQVRQAEAGLRAARAKLKQARDDGTDAEVDVARADVDLAKATVSLAKVQLGYAQVRSPHDGTVVALAANAGENASPGRTLLTVLDIRDAYARVYVPETRIGDIALGDTLTVRGFGRSYDGRVEFVSSQAEFTPNNVETEEQRAKLVYEVRVRILESGGALKPGMPVDVAVD